MRSSFEHHHPGSPESLNEYSEESTSELGSPGTLEWDDGRANSVSGPAPELANSATVAQKSSDDAASPTSSTTNAAPPVDPFAIGSTVRDRYYIESVLGTGGSAVVYRARDLHWELAEGGSACVAIKVLRPELRSRPQSIGRLKREFRQTVRITHPNVVRVFDLDCHADAWFIVMEVLEGRSLSAELRRSEEPFPLPRAAAILRACGEALTFAHARGVVHGDLKPANVFLLASGDVRLLDFGASPESAMLSDETAHHRYPIPPAATPAYASPEILARQTPELRDDIFSLSCIAHEMLFRQHPFERAAAEEHIRITVPGVRNDLSLGQITLLESGLALKREQRPKSVGALLEFLQAPPAEVPVLSPSLAIQPLAGPTSDSATLTLTPAPLQENVAAVLLGEAAITEASTAWLEPNEHEWSAMPLQWPVLTKAALPPMQRWAAAAVLALTFLGLISALQPETKGSATATAAVEVPVAAPKHASAAADIKEINPQSLPAYRAASRFDAVPITGSEPTTSKAARAVLANTKLVTPARSAPVQLVSFDVPSLSVSTKATAVVLTLKRVNGRDGRLRVSWRINADSAIAGRDFSGPTSGVIELAHWQTVQTLYVPLAHTSGAKRFTVAITGVSGGAKVAPNESVIVTLRDFG